MTRLMHAMAGILFTCIALFFSSTAWAQPPAESLHDMRLLARPGERLHVLDTSGADIRGRFVSVTADQLRLRVDGKVVEIGLPQLQEVRKREADSVANGAWIGFGAGVGSGVVVTAACRCAAGVAAIALYGGIFAVMGVGFDALDMHERTIFTGRSTAAAGGRRLQVAPILAPQTRGVGVSFQF